VPDEVAKEQLRGVKWFTEMPADQLSLLYRRARHRRFQRYALVVREGQFGSSFYVVLSGSLLLYSEAKGLRVRLGVGNYFGEAALLNDKSALLKAPRACSVEALERSELLQIYASDLTDLDVDLSEVRKHMIMLHLDNVAFFKSFPRKQIEDLANLMKVEYYPMGSPIFRKGDRADALYILAEGNVAMLDESGSTFAECDAKSKRPWFGEMVLWQAMTRGATAMPTLTVKLLVVHADQIGALRELCPSLLQLLAVSANAFKALNRLASETANAQVEDEATTQLALAYLSEMPHLARNSMEIVRNWERLCCGLLGIAFEGTSQAPP